VAWYLYERCSFDVYRIWLIRGCRLLYLRLHLWNVVFPHFFYWSRQINFRFLSIPLQWTHFPCFLSTKTWVIIFYEIRVFKPDKNALYYHDAKRLGYLPHKALNLMICCSNETCQSPTFDHLKSQKKTDRKSTHLQSIFMPIMLLFYSKHSAESSTSNCRKDLKVLEFY